MAAQEMTSNKTLASDTPQDAFCDADILDDMPRRLPKFACCDSCEGCGACAGGVAAADKSVAQEPKSNATQKARAKAKAKAESSPKRPKPKKGSAAWKRQRGQRVHTAVRFVVQIAFFALAPGLFSSALNGVKYICTQIGAVQAIEPGSFVAVLVAAVAYTVLFGRFFCGYACAFGTMGDVLFGLFAPLRKLLHIPSLQGRPRLLSCLQALKLVVLAAVCALCFTGFWDAVAAYSPWTVFGKVTSGAGFEGVAVKGVCVLACIMLMQGLFERSFCRFLCPMGALFSLLPVLPFSQFNRRREVCAKSCNRCQDACPVDIHPDQGSFHAGECISCGRCAVGCPLGNVNLVFVSELPAAAPADGSADKQADESADEKAAKKPAKPQALVKWRGSGVPTVLFKALVLLVVCWVVGLLRFVPSPADVLPFALPWM